jgi:hypothetical protein
MDGLSLSRGSVKATRDELDLIPVPPSTETYQPVSHHDLATKLVTIGHDILTDYTLIGENYGLARNGQQLFAVLKFKKGDSDMGLSVGFRNSYDKSMSVGFCCGASVFVCDNLALHGQIAVMKKHTKHIWTELEDLAITTLYKSQHTYQQIVTDGETMKSQVLDDDTAFGLLGYLFGHDILSPRMLPVVKDNWLKPQHEEFKARNTWSFYNAATEALKAAPPQSVMERHIALHNVFINGQV